MKKNQNLKQKFKWWSFCRKQIKRCPELWEICVFQSCHGWQNLPVTASILRASSPWTQVIFSLAKLLSSKYNLHTAYLRNKKNKPNTSPEKSYKISGIRNNSMKQNHLDKTETWQLIKNHSFSVRLWLRSHNIQQLRNQTHVQFNTEKMIRLMCRFNCCSSTRNTMWP